jgi:hypothetical protein
LIKECYPLLYLFFIFLFIGQGTTDKNNNKKSMMSTSTTASSSSSHGPQPQPPTDQEEPRIRLGPEDVDKLGVDDWLSKELTQLSFQDRNAIYEEIHGVHNPCPKETPALVEKSLQELDRHLQDIVLTVNKKKNVTNNTLLSTVAYEEALLSYQQQQDVLNDSTSTTSTTRSCYVNDIDFRLQFLRTELFDTHKAAIRLVKYCTLIKQFFGPIGLQRPVQISDLGRYVTMVFFVCVCVCVCVLVLAFDTRIVH